MFFLVSKSPSYGFQNLGSAPQCISIASLLKYIIAKHWAGSLTPYDDPIHVLHTHKAWDKHTPLFTVVLIP